MKDPVTAHLVICDDSIMTSSLSVKELMTNWTTQLTTNHDLTTLVIEMATLAEIDRQNHDDFNVPGDIEVEEHDDNDAAVSHLYCLLYLLIVFLIPNTFLRIRTYSSPC